MIHAPGTWIVVCDSPLIVSAMCTCGHDDCAFTVTAYDAINTHLAPTTTVKL